MNLTILSTVAALVMSQAPPVEIPAPSPAPVLAPKPVPAPGVVRARSVQPLGALFTMDDYPEEALAARAQGVVHFVVVVDAQGRPAECIITRSSTSAVLDRATCDILMARARYIPARDANGNAIPDRMSGRIQWQMPADGDMALQLMPLRLFEEIHLTAEGGLVCRARSNDFEYPQDEGCGPFWDESAITLLRSLGLGSRITLIVTIAPDGLPPPAAADGEAGEPTVSGAARLSVAPDGRVTNCRVTRQPDLRPVPGLEGVPDMCNLPMFDPDRMFRPDNWRTEVRLATLAMRLYIRPGPSR